MKSVFSEVKLSSKKEFELVDITKQVEECVAKSGVRNGIVVVFSQHTTGAIRISEYEEGLAKDFQDFFEKTAPKRGNYVHNRTNVDGRPNASSHLQSMILNSSETIPLQEGRMILGTWQTIFFVEVDGPREGRKVTVQVVGE